MWHVYTLGQKRKKRKVLEAVQWRKDRLVRNAAAHWLAVSCDLQQQRQLLSARQGLQTFHREQVLARRAASHWRHLVARRRSQRDASSREARVTVPLTSLAAHLYTLPVSPVRSTPVHRQQPILPVSPTVQSRYVCVCVYLYGNVICHYNG
jgi:hypothetical protein